MGNTEEIEAFCSNFDKFFDICYTRSIEEGEKKRKPNSKPFDVKEDQRLEVTNNFSSVIIRVGVVTFKKQLVTSY